MIDLYITTTQLVNGIILFFYTMIWVVSFFMYRDLKGECRFKFEERELLRNWLIIMTIITVIIIWLSLVFNHVINIHYIRI